MGGTTYNSKVEEFTADVIRKLTVPEGRVQQDWYETQHDGRSLILTKGRKTTTWSVMFYDKGKSKRKKIGAWPDMVVKAARKAARDFDADKAIAVAATGSFKEVAESFFKRHVEGNGLISAPEIRRHLERYVYPKWEKKPFAEIRRGMVNELLDDIADNSGKTQADAVLATLRKLMRWYQTRDDNYASPIVPGMNRSPNKKRERWLSDDEIRLLWAAIDKFDSQVFASIVKIMLLTGQREAKILTMARDDLHEIETSKGKALEWRIPRKARQKGTPVAITLPPLAASIIEALRDKRVADNPFVFTGRNVGSHFDSLSQRKEELDKKLPKSMPHWVWHDLRRTCRKLMTRAGVSSEIGELAIGHTIKGIQGVYDDPIEYRPQIDAALKKVEIEVQKVLKPDAKVIAFPA